MKSGSEELSVTKQALLALERMKTRVAELEAVVHEPLAIVGASCRLPGANSLDEYWQLLESGKNAIREVPADRWPIDTYYDPDPDQPGKVSTRRGGFIENIDLFDADFFGISPVEAEAIDPAQRIMLELAQVALDDAGLVAQDLAGSKTGVFVGACGGDYGRMMLGHEHALGAYTSTGGANSAIANRISYVYDFRGPSLVLDTACSSSLVALHVACQSLRRQESDVALAGGVNVILDPAWTISFSKFRMMAPDGACKTFDERADGFVRSEGGGWVVLKRLSDARRDRDRIYAVVRGTATNQDGHTNGLTAPNGLAQREVIRAALADANLSASRVTFVEAHGTGTPLGDPIEVEALGALYGAKREPGSRCALGSVKTNIGHLEAAAGIAGVLKTMLALSRQRMPKNLHFKRLNPRIELGDGLEVLADAKEWSDDERFGAVSAFGFGGTNAHAILASFADTPTPDSARDAETRILTLSAKSREALRERAADLQSFIESETPDVDALCHTNNARRSHYEHRAAIVFDTLADVTASLRNVDEGSMPCLRRGKSKTGNTPGLAFVFPGQGGQWLGMGRDLVRGCPEFRDAIRECSRALQSFMGQSLEEILLGDDPSWLEKIEFVQPAIFGVQVALTKTLSVWGVRPDATVGHSMGEVAAAYAAGMLNLSDAARIICRRSQLLRRVRGRGAMALVELSFDECGEVLRGLEEKLSVAAYNSPKGTVLSGEPNALVSVVDGLRAQGRFAKLIKVDVASHSPLVDELKDELLEALQGIVPQDGHAMFYSTVHGCAVEGRQLDAQYWMDNLRNPVAFSSTLAGLPEKGLTQFIEISPHPSLVVSMEEIFAQRGPHEEKSIHIGASLMRDAQGRRCLLETLAELYVKGRSINWKDVSSGWMATAPTYPFQRERFWFRAEDSERSTKTRSVTKRHHLLETCSRQNGRIDWSIRLTRQDYPYAFENRIHGTAIMPMTVGFEMLHAAVSYEGHSATFRNIQLIEPVVVSDCDSVYLQISLLGDGSGQKFEIRSRRSKGDTWTVHAVGLVDTDALHGPPSCDVSFKGSTDAKTKSSGTELYARLAKEGLSIGPQLRWIDAWREEDGAVTGCLRAPLGVSPTPAGYVDPALMEAALQLSGALSSDTSGPKVAVLLEELRFRGEQGPLPKVLWSRVEHRRGEASILDMKLCDEEGRLFAECAGVRLRRVDADSELMAVLTQRASVDRNRTATRGPAKGSVESRFTEIRELLCSELSSITRLSAERIEGDRTLRDLGVDSVMTLKLRNRLESALQTQISATVFFQHPTVDALARHFAGDGPPSSQMQAVCAESAVPAAQARNGGVALQPVRRDSIAIVGIGCRFPAEGNSPQAFWRALCQGLDGVGSYPKDRFGALRGRGADRQGAFISGVDRFDLGFFGISPKEASRMDPQQRLFLEVAWEAVEDAGLQKEALAGTLTSVFVGVNSNDYFVMQLQDDGELNEFSITSGTHCAIPNRLSYQLDLRGTSLAIDTACSSSLVAVHLACQELRQGRSELSIVGGVNLILSDEVDAAHTMGLPLSPDGRCHTFDARANGYVRGEGCGVVVLKRLSDALADDDRIWAVIAGSASNQDGRTNGVAAPNGLAQELVIRQAIADADVTAKSIDFVESHGTGTALGDPVEMEALTRVYGDERVSQCMVGAVKSNIGHLEAASGVAGLIKAALCLHHESIPKNLHFESLNPLIELDTTRFRVAEQQTTWPITDTPARAGVSAFGAGGTNAHVVLEVAPKVRRGPVEDATSGDEKEPSRAASVLVLSARSKGALAAQAQRYAAWIDESEHAWYALCASAFERRTAFEHRLAVAASSKDVAAGRLRAAAQSERDDDGTARGRVVVPASRKVAFVFPGQGGQWTGMGRRLIAVEPDFAKAIGKLEAAMRDHVSWSLSEKLRSANWEDEPIDVIQPTLFAFQVALVDLWRKWGVEPDAVIGHSMGEVAASYVCGSLNLRDALCVICRRSRKLLARSRQGKMAVVGLAMNDVRCAYLDGEERVTIAAYNGPDSTVISGDEDRIRRVVQACRADNVFAKEIDVDVASHSPQMDVLLPGLISSLEDIEPKEPVIPMVSTVTGEDTSATRLNGEYWARNLRDPVLLWPAVQGLASEDKWSFIEISPHPVLSSGLSRGLSGGSCDAIVGASLQRDMAEDESFYAAIARQYCCGVPLKWGQAVRQTNAYVPLPTYAWHRRSYWLGRRRAQRPSDARVAVQAEVSTVPDEASEVTRDTATTGFRRRLEHALVSDRRSLMLDRLQAVVSDTLGFSEDESYEIEQGFFQLGMDSRMVTSMVARVSTELGLSLEVGVVFKNPTTASFCDYLMSRFDDAADSEQEMDDDELSTLARELGYVE